MKFTLNAHRLAVIFACGVLASTAWAATPDVLPDEFAGADIAAPPAALDYALETEMVVRNWVLCVSAPSAEQLARARTASLDEARSTYAELASARSCGQFPSLRVILRERVYASDDASGHDTRVFGALVNLSGDWANAFLVSGGLPEE